MCVKNGILLRCHASQIGLQVSYAVIANLFSAKGKNFDYGKPVVEAFLVECDGTKSPRSKKSGGL